MLFWRSVIIFITRPDLLVRSFAQGALALFASLRYPPKLNRNTLRERTQGSNAGRAAFRAEIRVAAGGDGCRTLKSSWNSGAWVLHLRLKFAIDTLPVVNQNEIERNERRVFYLGLRAWDLQVCTRFGKRVFPLKQKRRKKDHGMHCGGGGGAGRRTDDGTDERDDDDDGAVAYFRGGAIFAGE